MRRSTIPNSPTAFVRASAALCAIMVAACGSAGDSPTASSSAIGVPEVDPGIVPSGVRAQRTIASLFPISTELIVGTAQGLGATTTWATWLNSQAPSDERCGRREIGPCVLYDCRGSVSETGWLRVLGAAGGDVTITSGSMALSLRPNENGRYVPTRQTQNNDWRAGGDVAIGTSGGSGVSALQFSLTLPDLLVLTGAPWDDPNARMWTIRRISALPLQWQSVPGEVAVEIDETAETETPGLNDRTLLCVFPGDAGGAVVPVEAMASLQRSSSAEWPKTTLRVGRRVSKRFENGPAGVSVSLINAVEVRLNVR